MSHELRTPLNSSLILAKLLAENPQENLTEEQVKFAESIYSAGNDLLNLINDILDISKVEAGKLDMRPENSSVGRLVDGLRMTFEPLAADKQAAVLGGSAAGRAGVAVHRSPASGADPQKSAVQRGQVHRSGRGQPDRVASAGRGHRLYRARLRYRHC